MLASLLTVPAAAADTGRFSDVTDSYTATAIETLRRHLPAQHGADPGAVLQDGGLRHGRQR